MMPSTLEGRAAVIMFFVLIPLASFSVLASMAPPFATPRLLVAGDYGSLYVFDGTALKSIPTPTISNLTQMEWRHDGSYALIVGKDETVLEYDGHTIKQIRLNLPRSENFYALSWRPGDAEALIVGSRGTVVRFDGQHATTLSSGLNRTLFAVKWSPIGSYALIAGADGTLAKFEGGIFTKIPSQTKNNLYTIDWQPTGAYALIGGAWATLLKYEIGLVSSINMMDLFGNNPRDAHWISSVKFNQDAGDALIVGHKGLTVVYSQGAMRRTRLFSNLGGAQEDLHHIGHFFQVSWVPGTHTAYAVGEDGTVARMTQMSVKLWDGTDKLIPQVKVELVTQGKMLGDLKSIESY